MHQNTLAYNWFKVVRSLVSNSEMQWHSALEVLDFISRLLLSLTPATDNPYQERIELKSNADRTLGVGVIEAESAILVLTAATMMKAYVDMEQVEEFDPE